MLDTDGGIPRRCAGWKGHERYKPRDGDEHDLFAVASTVVGDTGDRLAPHTHQSIPRSPISLGDSSNALD